MTTQRDFRSSLMHNWILYILKFIFKNLEPVILENIFHFDIHFDPLDLFFKNLQFENLQSQEKTTFRSVYSEI